MRLGEKNPPHPERVLRWEVLSKLSSHLLDICSCWLFLFLELNSFLYRGFTFN